MRRLRPMADRRRYSLCGAVAAVAAAGLLGAPSSIGATAKPYALSPTLRLMPYLSDVGWINVRVAGTPGSTVAVAELGPSGPEPLLRLRLAAPSSARRHVLGLRCDRLERHLVASATRPDGSTETADAVIHTAACTHRLRAVVTPARPRVGSPATVSITDLWHSGDLAFATCVTPPQGTPRCRPQRLAPGAAALAVRFRAGRIGRWRVEVSDPYQRISESVDVRRGRVVLLATGDSEIQGIDDDLAAALRGPSGARVISEAHISSSISGSFFFDWPAHAPQQARADHPDVTVMYLGGNEGFPLRSRAGRQVPCCGRDWIAAYADRVQRMMAAYLRGGAGRVYWFTLPTPSSSALARVLRAVNPAILIAAQRFPVGVRVVDIRPVFTPGGRFRSSMIYRGRSVVVREPDGTHLSLGGDAIAANILVADMRADGVVG